MMRAAIVLLTVAGLGAIGCGGSGDNTAPKSGASGLRVPELPPVPPLPSVPDDPITPAKIVLGSDLFFDKRLSGSGQTHCNSCHIFNTSFQDNLPLSTPDRSYPGDVPTLPRSTLSFINIIYAPVFRWDGSHTDIVQVLAFPFAEPNMNTAGLPAGNFDNDVPAAQKALYHKLTVDLPGYLGVYRAAFDVDITTLDEPAVWALTGRGLRAFVSQAISANAPFDRWNAGDDAALSDSAQRGLAVFRTTGRCILCHRGAFFTDFDFHNLSTAWLPGGTRGDDGRFKVTGVEADRGKFLTPTLRQTYDTSPYFHDGSRLGLRDVLKHISSDAVSADPNHDPIFTTHPVLTDDDMDNLVEFMKSLRAPASTAIAPPTSFP